MKDFSNEHEQRHKRRRAILKTVVKRYSIFVWLPILLYAFYIVGRRATLITEALFQFHDASPDNNTVYEAIIYIMLGFAVFAGIIVIISLCNEFLKYLKRKTIWKDIKENVVILAKGIAKVVCFIIKLPKKIYNRIKNEPKRFKESVYRELAKQEENE